MKKFYFVLSILFSFATLNGIAQTLFDSYTDGNFTTAPVWGGNTTLWTITANSDVAAGASGSNTLRLNSTGGSTDYLSSQVAAWDVSQEWGFFLGRRAQAFTGANQQYFWLYANEATLTSATVDGYRIAIGDDAGGDDIRLEYIVNGSLSATVITSSGSLTNGLTDIGLLIRVTRSSTGLWNLYTSILPTANGAGAIATGIPNAANTTVSQGSATHNTLVPAANGYLGVAALHSTGTSAVIAAEFDQIYFTPSSSNSITTGVISPLSYCDGAAVSVPYTISGTFTAGNVFTAQLSNAAGSFTSPVAIGTLTSTVAGTISATIPAGTAAGTGYRIRVISSTPAVTGSVNGSDITINTAPATPGAITGTAAVCQSQNYPYSISAVSGASSYTWTYSGTGGTITPSSNTASINYSAVATSGNLQVTATNSCGTSAAASLAVIVSSCANTISTSSVSGPLCAGNNLTVNYSITGVFNAGNVFTAQLSDAAGSFTSPTNIGSVTATTNTSISATIPIGTAFGTGYLVRVVASNPVTTGTPGAAFTVNVPISISAQPSTGIQTICSAGTLIALSVTASGTTPTYQWFSNVVASNSGGTLIAGATTASYLPSNTLIGTTYYYVVVSGASPCASVASNVSGAITVNALPALPAGIISGTTPACTSSALAISSSAPAGETYYWQTSATGTSLVNAGSTYTATTSATFYVRSRNNSTLCWSNATTGYAVVVNAAPSISVQPTNQTVTAPASTSFSVTATGVSAYQWQLNSGTGWANVPAAAPYSGVTTATLTINPSTGLDGVNYRCVLTASAPCVNLTSSEVQLTVFPGPCITDAAGYTGWTLTGATVSASQACSGNGILFAGQGQTVVTPAVTNPLALNFNKKRSGSTNAWELKVQISTSATGPWTDVYTTTTISATCAANPSIDLSPYTGTQYIRFLDNRPAIGAEQRGIDDISITCGATCTPVHTITSFSPTTGPAGTVVTITGTNLSAATGVKFGTLNAASFTVLNATTIIAEVPQNAPVDKIKVTKSGCEAVSPSVFNTILVIGSCGTNGSGSTVTDISISEVYDALSGSLSYIEIFNGTASPVVLGAPNNYVVRVNTGAVNDYALSGTLNSGSTYIVRLGTGVICSAITPDVDLPSASGFNGDDFIYLRKNGIDIDYVPNGNISPGFSQRRRATTTAATIPSTTFTASDWIVSTTEDCSDLGLPPYVIGGNSITINTQPADENDCSAISFTVSATSSAPPPNYLWKYFNTVTGLWENASGITNATLGVTASNTTTATMSITGNTAHLQDYQFYCELEEGACKTVTSAVQFTYSTRPIYRSKVAAGNWTSPSTWEMSTDNITFVPVCQYPVAANSDHVIIKTGNSIVLDVDVSIDKLTIETGAVLSSSPNAELSLLNGGAGADFIIAGTGTYVDRSNSANSIVFNAGATWQISNTGTLVKTNSSSAVGFRDNYEGGISTIPAGASWIYRYNGDGSPAVTTVGMFYPDLYFESVSGAYSWNGFTTALTGSTGGFATVNGNMFVGTTGTGTVSVYNNNINTQAMLVKGNLSIGTGSTLTNVSYDAVTDANHGNGTGFEIKGNLLVNGTLTNNGGTAETGNLIFSGTGTQTVSGILAGLLNLEDVIINNTTATANVLVDKSFAIPGTLNFGNAAAKLSLNTGDITLKSTASRTANVGILPAPGSINYPGTGRFIVERYILTPRKWQFLSVPTNTLQTVKAAWQEAAASQASNPVPNFGTQITSFYSDWNARGFDNYSPGGHSMKFWDISLQKYAAQPNTSASINSTKGYMLFVRGSRAAIGSAGSGSTTLRTRGQLFTGNQPGISVPAGSYVSIGNPFASAINMQQINLPVTMTQAFYIWDPRLSGAYGLGGFQTFSKIGADWIPTPGGGSYAVAPFDKNFIQSGLAFFVKGDVGASSVVLEENDKAPGSTTATRIFNEPSLMRVNLYTGDGNNEALMDGVLVHFEDGFDSGIDRNDASKMGNEQEKVSLLKNNLEYAVLQEPLLRTADTFYLKISGMRTRNYKWQLNFLNMNTPGRQAWLVDKLDNTRTPLDLERSNSVSFAVTNDSLTYAPGRFLIVFRQKKKIRFVSFAAFRNASKSVNGEWTVADDDDTDFFEIERSGNGTDFHKIGQKPKGAAYILLDEQSNAFEDYYRIKAIHTDSTVLYSNIVKVTTVPQGSFIKVTPNPVENRIVSVQLQNQPAGKYLLTVVNASGQEVASKFVDISHYIETVRLSAKNLASGTYYLSIKMENGNSHTLDFIIE